MTDGSDEKVSSPESASGTSGLPEEKVGVIKARITDLEGQMAQKDEEMARTTARIAELEEVLSGRESEIASLKQTRTGLETALAGAVTSYRAVVLQANQEIVEDLVSGDTVEAIDDSLARAKALLGKVRQGLAMELAMIRVPAGAPERTAPHISGLSPREKIQYAIGGNR